jgi:CRP-like cAMP-binding protein
MTATRPDTPLILDVKALNMTNVMSGAEPRCMKARIMSDATLFDRNPFLRALSSAGKKRALPLLHPRTVARGDRVWTEGEAAGELTFVVKGRVKFVKAIESGRDAILEMVAPGELLCTGPTFAHAPHCCTSVAMEDTEVVALRRVDVLDLLEQSPSAAKELLREVGCHRMSMCQRAEELSSGLVEQRIAKLLLKLSDRAGVERHPDGLWVPVPLSRQDLADLCGTTLETAIRVMSAFRRRDLVRTSTRGFSILDRAGLEQVLAGKRSADAGTLKPRRAKKAVRTR